MNFFMPSVKHSIKITTKILLSSKIILEFFFFSKAKKTFILTEFGTNSTLSRWTTDLATEVAKGIFSKKLLKPF